MLLPGWKFYAVFRRLLDLDVTVKGSEGPFAGRCVEVKELRRFAYVDDVCVYGCVRIMCGVVQDQIGKMQEKPKPRDRETRM